MTKEWYKKINENEKKRIKMQQKKRPTKYQDKKMNRGIQEWE